MLNPYSTRRHRQNKRAFSGKSGLSVLCGLLEWLRNPSSAFIRPTESAAIPAGLPQSLRRARQTRRGVSRRVRLSNRVANW